MKKLFHLPIDENRIFGLDVLRTVAILIVVFDHGLAYLPNVVNRITTPLIIDGVGIFFVLSGFLIGSIFLKKFEKDLSIGALISFWKRRWYRTIPNYFLILIIILLLELITSGRSRIAHVWDYFFFLQNFAWPIKPFFVESWSLTIEEWFYILIPLLLFFCKTSKKTCFKWLSLFVILLVIIIVTGIRVRRYFNLVEKSFEVWDYNFNRQVISRLDSIMYGVFAAWIKKYKHKYWTKAPAILFWIGIITLILQHNFGKLYDPCLYILGFSFNAAGVAFTLPFMENIKKPPVRIAKLITFISLISYSMYLINLSLVRSFIIDKYLLINNYLQYSIYWLLTIIISFFLYKYFEIPTTKLRDRFK